ncbi:hypothetical protein RIF29_29986 [Crotalaria pallida]|uniref:Uncharacterized protein n=1 Tax=Crotalaria pallida TaxID=3830 RepID=A0AAN9EMC3_CROPI
MVDIAVILIISCCSVRILDPSFESYIRISRIFRLALTFHLPFISCVGSLAIVLGDRVPGNALVWLSSSLGFSGHRSTKLGPWAATEHLQEFCFCSVVFKGWATVHYFHSPVVSPVLVLEYAANFLDYSNNLEK